MMKKQGGTAECLSGRGRELQTLERLFYSDHLSSLLFTADGVWGKTAFDQSFFFQDKDAIYFMGVESSEKQNLLKA